MAKHSEHLKIKKSANFSGSGLLPRCNRPSHKFLLLGLPHHDPFPETQSQGRSCLLQKGLFLLFIS